REGLDPAALGGDDRGHHRLLVDVQPADVLANNLQLTLPPSRLGRTWGGRFSFEESLQRAPASGRGNNSRSLSVRQPMLPHELVASVSARATSAPDHQEANLGPPAPARPRHHGRRGCGPARDVRGLKVPGRAFRSPAESGEYPAKPGEGGIGTVVIPPGALTEDCVSTSSSL